MFARAVYRRGAMTLQALREKIGDEPFFRIPPHVGGPAQVRDGHDRGVHRPPASRSPNRTCRSSSRCGSTRRRNPRSGELSRAAAIVDDVEQVVVPVEAVDVHATTGRGSSVTIAGMAAVRGLPPGPRWPVALQTLRYGLDPYGLFESAQRAFGDVFTLRVMAETWVVLAHPDAVRELYGYGPDEVDSGEANLALRPLLGTRSVLLLDGAEHLRRRKLVLPPFHGERMRAYGDLIREATRREIATVAVGRSGAYAAADAGHHAAGDPARGLRRRGGTAARPARRAAAAPGELDDRSAPRPHFGFLGPDRAHQAPRLSDASSPRSTASCSPKSPVAASRPTSATGPTSCRCYSQARHEDGDSALGSGTAR